MNKIGFIISANVGLLNLTIPASLFIALKEQEPLVDIGYVSYGDNTTRLASCLSREEAKFSLANLNEGERNIISVKDFLPVLNLHWRMTFCHNVTSKSI